LVFTHKLGQRQASVVFCIYISGSACSTVGVHSQAWSTSGIGRLGSISGSACSTVGDHSQAQRHVAADCLEGISAVSGWLTCDCAYSLWDVGRPYTSLGAASTACWRRVPGWRPNPAREPGKSGRDVRCSGGDADGDSSGPIVVQ
jgi:hypothetical protein